MGEYAKRKSDGTEIKIGTCDSMYYLRYEDRDKVIPMGNNVNPAIETGLFFRLPFPDEDKVLPGDYDKFNRSYMLSSYFTDPTTIENTGRIQLRHDNGLLLSVTCYHGEKLPEESKDLKAAWKNKSWSYELVSIKSLPNGQTKPVVCCRHCQQLWSYDWSDIMPYLQDDEMKERLQRYADEEERQTVKLIAKAS